MWGEGDGRQIEEEEELKGIGEAREVEKGRDKSMEEWREAEGRTRDSRTTQEAGTS